MILRSTRPVFRRGLLSVQRLAGDTAGAKVTAEQARNTLEQSHRDQPDNANTWRCSVSSLCRDGQKDLALKAAERAIMLYPRAKDPMDGPVYEENLALIQTIVGENSRAISTPHRAVTNAIWRRVYSPMPITPALLQARSDSGIRLRGDPAFQNSARISSTNALQFSRLRT